MNKCFAWNPKDCSCEALTDVQKGCGTTNCPFYKTAAQARASERRAKARLRKLGFTAGGGVYI